MTNASIKSIATSHRNGLPRMKTYEIQQLVTDIVEAEVVEFADGQCALLWTSVMKEIKCYPSLDEVKRVAVNTRRKLVRIKDKGQ